MFMVKEEKRKEVERVLKLMEEYTTIGILDMFGMATKQLQQIKKGLGENALIISTKKSMLRLAIKKSKKVGLSELEKLISQQPGLIFSKLDAFKLYLLADSVKSFDFAKEGDILQKTIEIKAGPSNLSPGPVIGELSRAGIPVGVEGGKIAIKKDVILEAGQTIGKELASALKKLGIPTKEVGLNIVALYSDGKVYGKDVLSLVGKQSLNLLKECFGKALNFSIAINYPTRENIGYLLAKALREAELIKIRIGG